MSLIDLKERPEIAGDAKLSQRYMQLGKLLGELRKQGLSGEVISVINRHVRELNDMPLADAKFSKLVRTKQTAIITKVEKEHKIVPIHYYRNLWLAVGMSAFGIPLGVAFGISLDNMAFLSLGLPIGLAIGMAVGAGLDAKAAKEGRQLDIEIK